MESFLCALGTTCVLGLEPHPDVAFFRILLYIDPVNLAEVGANHLDLLFDIDEVCGLLLQVDLGGIKHIAEKKTVGRGNINWLLTNRLLWS